jgi:hypothetical protein
MALEQRMAMIHPARTIAALLPDLCRDPFATMLANLPYTREGGTEFEIAQGWIVGPVETETLSKEQIANTVLRDFARSYGLDLLLPPGRYLRWSIDAKEIDLARKRTLRNSQNHRAKRPEAGVAVAEGPWVYGKTREHCYILEGTEVGRGSDAEPLLDRKSITVVGDLKSRAWVYEEFHRRNRDLLNHLSLQHGVDPPRLFCFLLGACS